MSPDGPDADAGARRLGVDAFVALWRAERSWVDMLVDDPAVIEAQVRGGRLEIDAAGVLVGAHGLVARRTRHRIDHGAGSVHTWCALDAIGIPAALGIDATAVTSCPTCDEALRVRIRDGEPIDAEDARLWLPRGPCKHLVADFCAHANLYCNGRHLASIVRVSRAGGHREGRRRHW